MAEKSTTLTEDEVKAIVDAEKKDAIGSSEDSTLSGDRDTALKYYMGEMPDMPAEPDQSAAISTDVADTVEGILPWLTEIFTSGESVVRFNPVGEEDEPLAEQETDVCNLVLLQKNPGFLILQAMMKDSLLSKTGTVKVRFETREEEEREIFRDLTDEELAVLMMAVDESDGKIEIKDIVSRDAGEEPPTDQIGAG